MAGEKIVRGIGKWKMCRKRRKKKEEKTKVER